MKAALSNEGAVAGDWVLTHAPIKGDERSVVLLSYHQFMTGVTCALGNEGKAMTYLLEQEDVT